MSCCCLGLLEPYSEVTVMGGSCGKKSCAETWVAVLSEVGSSSARGAMSGWMRRRTP